MLKDLVIFIFLMCFGAAIASVIYWGKLTPAQQQALVDDIFAYLDENQGSSSVSQQVKKPPNKVNKSELIPGASVEKGESVREGFSKEYFQKIVCRKPETHEIKQTNGQKVYRWIDKNGKVQFSDVRPDENNDTFTDISANYQESIQYLDLHLIDDNAELLLGNKERITADLSQIYYLLASEMKVKNLRRIELNVRLFSRQEAFQAYRQLVAPAANTTSGFYVPELNEATVFQRRNNDEVTFSVIRHEASHVIMASLFGGTPTWFNEGLAEYFEELYISGQGKTAKFISEYHRTVAEHLYASTLPALRDYFVMEPRYFYGESIEFNYAIAWSLLFFMLSDDEGKAVFAAIIAHFLAYPCLDVDMVKLLNNHYPGGFNNFESKWHNWLANPYNTSHYY